MRAGILAAALFLSGVSALLFETLWLRQGGLAFGNSVWAAALILSSFMAGLALGNLLAGVSRIRRIRPLYLYAILEGAIALCGALIVFGLPHAGALLSPLYQRLWNYPTTLLALRFVASFLLFLVPTTAMGLTLPVLVGDPLLKEQRFGWVISLFYGVNTIGAVAGALAGEAWLIEHSGLKGTGIVAAAANLGAAILALSVGTRQQTNVVVEEKADRASLKNHIPWRLLAVSFLGGMLLLTLEVVWFRFLRLYVASTGIAFAVMLAVVLAGIGLGALVSGLIPARWRKGNNCIVVLLLVAAAATLLSYICFPASAARTAAGPFDIDDWRTIALLATALMLPVSLASGVLFPVVVSRINDEVGFRTNSVGLGTLANTVGATLGPIIAVFVLLPRMGFQNAIVVCAVGYGIAALVAFRPEHARRSTGAFVLQGALGIVLALAVVLFPYHRDEMHFAHARELYSAEGSKLARKIDGLTDTMQLLRRDLYGQPYYYQFLTNSFSMSATSPASQRYMRLFAYLPLFLKPAAERALLICYGCGVTADALVKAPQLRHVDIVDISREVFELAADYRAPGYTNPLENPKTERFVQDGRFYLQATTRRYDLITGEPPPLKVAGTVNLYTREFFALMKSRLTDGGIATFWLPIYQVTPTETKAILKAFYEVFPNSSLWSGLDTEWIMMGVNGSLPRASQSEASPLWTDNGTRADLLRIGIEKPEQLAACFLMSDREIEEITNGIAPLADDYPKRLGDAPPDDAETYRFAWSYLRSGPAMQRYRSAEFINQSWPAMDEEEVQKAFALREDGFLQRVTSTSPLEIVDRYLRTSDWRSPILAALQTDPFRVELARRAANAQGPSDPEILYDLAADAVASRQVPKAIELLERKSAVNFRAEDAMLLVYLYCVDGRVGSAEEVAARYLGHATNNPALDWLWVRLRTEFGFRPPVNH